MLVIGCGNSDRGDDGAGVLVARRLRGLGVPAVERAGAGLELMDTWEGEDEVIVVDAVVTGSAPGTLFVWDARTAPLDQASFCCSTHSFGLGEAIQLGKILERLPARLTIYGIEGATFEAGAAPSAAVTAAAEQLAQAIAQSASALAIAV